MGLLGDIVQGVTHPADTYHDALRAVTGGKRRESFDMPGGPNGPPVQTQFNNPETVGGDVGTQIFHGDNAPEIIHGPDETQRYRGLGEAAAARQAYQPDFGKAMGNEAQGWAAHENQAEAARGLSAAAHGAAPSQAAILGGHAAGQSLQAQMQASAGTRGLGAAAAQQQAAQGMAGQQLGALGQFAGMRGAEMQHAQNSYGAAGGIMRAGDLSQQGMAQQRAEAQAASQAAQNKLNQQAQMGFEQMGINTQQADVNGQLRQQAMQNQANADRTIAQDARDAREMEVAKAGVSAVGAVAASDSRAKQRVTPLSDPMGHALETGLRPFQYEYKPGFRESEGQAPGEKNIGPMAQDMASNPITGSAVKQAPNGLLMIDMPKATKLNSAGIGYLAAKQRKMEEELADMKGGR